MFQNQISYRLSQENNKPFLDLEEGTEESTSHSDSRGVATGSTELTQLYETETETLQSRAIFYLFGSFKSQTILLWIVHVSLDYSDIWSSFHPLESVF